MERKRENKGEEKKKEKGRPGEHSPAVGSFFLSLSLFPLIGDIREGCVRVQAV